MSMRGIGKFTSETHYLYLSFIDPPLGVFGEIFPEVKISSLVLKEIFRRIPRAEGL